MAMCQRVFVEIIYMLPNCSEHKANCLTVKADCMFTVWPSACSVALCPDIYFRYIYNPDARDNITLFGRTLMRRHTRLKWEDCLSLLIEASRFPPTEQFVIFRPQFIASSKRKFKGYDKKRLKLKSRARWWWMKGKAGHSAQILPQFLTPAVKILLLIIITSTNSRNLWPDTGPVSFN